MKIRNIYSLRLRCLFHFGFKRSNRFGGWHLWLAAFFLGFSLRWEYPAIETSRIEKSLWIGIIPRLFGKEGEYLFFFSKKFLFSSRSQYAWLETDYEKRVRTTP